MSNDYKILIERGDQKLLFLEGPLEVIAGAVSGFLERELKLKPRKVYANGRTIVKFDEAEDARLIEAVKSGVAGPKLRKVLPKRNPASIRSRVVLLGKKGKFTPDQVRAAILHLASGGD